jgi:hypothetical protein
MQPIDRGFIDSYPQAIPEFTSVKPGRLLSGFSPEQVDLSTSRELQEFQFFEMSHMNLEQARLAALSTKTVVAPGILI